VLALSAIGLLGIVLARFILTGFEGRSSYTSKISIYGILLAFRAVWAAHTKHQGYLYALLVPYVLTVFEIGLLELC
jgi:hypothetical protein